ncbi:gamma-glutamyl AIG2-like cyclotransferase [Albidovulum inexpectatum]|uniref:Gamma-glutamyl AIG2-like cyclotransferase n=1 Tax=Albidovulum inexpectatum TaxID=196587 RepID=A0A2S5JKY3_9RHOB|nr:gamma-glutamylcyclotransferase family protein [Albidovulum inexpectatum]PPB82092.1 gamma-glutamyl AIG2-like cyclotransferase [Albidovulum inexpectatum]
MEVSRHPAFFGYGSLVNRATHDHSPAVSARLSGWRRIWRQTRLRPWPFLSVEPHAGTRIEGLIAAVPGADWAALDRREAAYERTKLPPDSLTGAPGWATGVEIYAIAPRQGEDAPRGPILLSYLDVVVQGFLREFGPDGAARFFSTTAHWGPVLDDRADPLYPRGQRLGMAERAIVDDHIDGLGLARQTRRAFRP